MSTTDNTKKKFRSTVHEPKNVIVTYEIEAKTQEEADRIAEEKYHKAFPLKRPAYNPVKEEAS